MITVEALAPWLGGALALGGVAVAATRRRELMLRWCLWALGVPVVVALFWWGDVGVAILAVAVALVATFEYCALTGLGWVDRAVLAAVLVGLVLTAWLDPGQTVRVLGAGVLVLAALPVVAGDAAGGFRRVSAAVFGLVWLSPLAGLVPLGATALALFVAISVADIVAYFAGPRLGGPHLSPLSPSKRWSGTLAGAVVGIGTLVLVGAWTWPLAVAVAVGGPVGDLIESMVKRGVRAKDSGTWLAGAGGLLDRIDSMLVALAVTLVLG